MSEKQELGDLIEYQDESIVSRVVLKGSHGNVTLFAFDEGQQLSEHTVSNDAMIYLIEGRAEVTISGERRELGQGDMVVLPANQPHAVAATERFKMILMMIKS